MSNFDNNLNAQDLVFYTDKEGGIYSGGFSVISIMMKTGMSPLSTLERQTNNDILNDNSIGKIFNGGELMRENSNINKVSDLFDNLAVPSWLLSYNTNFIHDDLNDKTNDLNGGSNYKNYKKENMDLNEDSDNDEIDDDLYNKLLDIVKAPNKKGDVEEEGEVKDTENKIKEEKLTKKKTRRQVNNDKYKTKTKKNKK